MKEERGGWIGLDDDLVWGAVPLRGWGVGEKVGGWVGGWMDGKRQGAQPNPHTAVLSSAFLICLRAPPELLLARLGFRRGPGCARVMQEI